MPHDASVPYARDLTWALCSPCPYVQLNDNSSSSSAVLLDTHEFDNTTQDVDEAVLRDFVVSDKKSKILGQYFASLIEFYLRSRPEKYRDLEAGVQVFNDNKRTIGEFDLLFRATPKDLKLDDKPRLHLVHWELSLKYKLFVPPGTFNVDIPLSSLTDEELILFYIGPHQSETSYTKLRKLTRQTALSANPFAQQRLRSIFGVEGDQESKIIIKSFAMVRGYMFYPLNPDGTLQCPTLSSFINPGHLRGWWTSLEDAKGMNMWQDTSKSQVKWFFLDNKLHWMSSIRLPRSQCRMFTSDNVNENTVSEQEPPELKVSLSDNTGQIVFMLYTFYDMLQRAADMQAAATTVRRRRIMLARVDLNEMEDCWVETSRGFIVEDDWANKARVIITNLLKTAKDAHTEIVDET